MKIQSHKDIKKELEGLILSNKEKSLKMLNEILDLIPEEYSDIINQAFIYKRIPKEYLLSSILFSVSSAIGMTFYIKELGYTNYGNLYFTIIGSRGDTKSEAIKIGTNPIKEMDDLDYDEFCEELKSYNAETDDYPIRKQNLIQDATIEAVHKIHSENPNAVGVLMDEIFSLIEKMGNSNSRDGVPWRVFLLEGYTNGCVDISRKTVQGYRIKNAYPTMLGGLQNQFIPKLFSNGNLESGLIDRLLFTPKLTNNMKLSKGQISDGVTDAYNSSIFNILEYKRQSEQPDEENKQFEIKFSKEAKDTLYEYSQNLINKQGIAKPIIKEYMAKMQISIHKFCLLIHMMKISSNMDFTKLLDVNTVELAILLNEFYFNNFKIILEDNLQVDNKESIFKLIVDMTKKNGGSQKAVCEVTGAHKSTVSKCWNRDKRN